MHTQFSRARRVMLLAAVWIGSSVAMVMIGQSGQEIAAQDKAAAAVSAGTGSSTQSPGNGRIRQSMLASRRSKGERQMYESMAGVDSIKIQRTASGTLLRFSYRVCDPNRAKALSDKNVTPYLIDQKTGAALQIPEAPNLGKVRQTAEKPVKGQEYWMAFSNKGVIKPGDRVDAVFGNQRLYGLVVQ